MYQMNLEKIRENADYEVIVIGGGPSGCTAAAAASRGGKKTLLIEASGVLGGMGTLGLVPCFPPYGYGTTQVYGGLAWEVRERMIKYMPYYHQADRIKLYLGVDPEILKRAYDELIEDYGVDVLFYSRICSVETDGDGTVTSVLIAANNGLTAYRAKVFVDCTGDGLTAVWAGAEFEKGDEDGDLMPATLAFTVGNVNDDAYRDHPTMGWMHGTLHRGNPNAFIHKVVAEGKHPLIPDTHFCDNTVGPKMVGFNAGHIWDVDATDPVSMSKATILGRKMAWELFDVTKEYFPSAFGDSQMIGTANIVGTREGNRIKGDYELVLEDFINQADFPDEIGRTCCEVDVHPPRNRERAKELEKRIGDNAITPEGSMGIPYRCLTPKGLKNVLVAGRSISCERIMTGCIRVMSVCLVTGEAAGAAAAMAASMEQCDVHQVDTDELREHLRKYGAIFR